MEDININDYEKNVKQSLYYHNGYWKIQQQRYNDNKELYLHQARQRYLKLKEERKNKKLSHAEKEVILQNELNIITELKLLEAEQQINNATPPQ